MPASKAEQILDALKVLLETVPGAKVERNKALPEKIPASGLIVLRDGDPGEPEQALGGFAGAYYGHRVEVEVYVENGDAAARDTAFDLLLQEIGTALEADPTLAGLAFGVTYGRPAADVEAIEGAAAIKTGTLAVVVDYETDAPLA
ncbi:MAG: acyl-CoA transferase [Rhodospirillales bacterium]|nr:acyl-CoA transferase [Rhodospirillales bacterium]